MNVLTQTCSVPPLQVPSSLQLEENAHSQCYCDSGHNQSQDHNDIIIVSSRLDYCNSLFSGIAETDLTKLQRTLNRLACVVTKSPPFTRSVPLLCSLLWLPVKYRVHFKICVLTCKALHDVYLRSLIATSLPSHSLRSNRGITLPVPRIKINTGARVFSSLAQPPTICPFSHLGCHLQKTSQNIPFQLGLPPVDTGVPNGLLMLRNSFKDFVFEHRSGCCATEPGSARDIGAMKI